MKRILFIKCFTIVTGFIAFLLLFIVSDSLSNGTLAIGQAKIMCSVLLPYMILAQIVYKTANKKAHRYSQYQ